MGWMDLVKKNHGYKKIQQEDLEGYFTHIIEDAYPKGPTYKVLRVQA